MNCQNELTYLCALRGATTCENNSVESITSAVEELLVELVSRNNLIPDQIISITFSITSDSVSYTHLTLPTILRV